MMRTFWKIFSALSLIPATANGIKAAIIIWPTDGLLAGLCLFSFIFVGLTFIKLEFRPHPEVAT